VGLFGPFVTKRSWANLRQEKEISVNVLFLKKARLGGGSRAPREHGKGLFKCVLMGFWCFCEEKVIICALLDRMTACPFAGVALRASNVSLLTSGLPSV